MTFGPCSGTRLLSYVGPENYCIPGSWLEHRILQSTRLFISIFHVTSLELRIVLGYSYLSPPSDCVEYSVQEIPARFIPALCKSHFQVKEDIRASNTAEARTPIFSYCCLDFAFDEPVVVISYPAMSSAKLIGRPTRG